MTPAEVMTEFNRRIGGAPIRASLAVDILEHKKGTTGRVVFRGDHVTFYVDGCERVVIYPSSMLQLHIPSIGHYV